MHLTLLASNPRADESAPPFKPLYAQHVPFPAFPGLNLDVAARHNLSAQLCSLDLQDCFFEV